jgi:hypothetical protein
MRGCADNGRNSGLSIRFMAPHRVAAQRQRGGADRSAEIEGGDLAAGIAGNWSASSTLSPMPVEPAISVWPTSPTWRENRNGEASVRAKQEGQAHGKDPDDGIASSLL